MNNAKKNYNNKHDGLSGEKKKQYSIELLRIYCAYCADWQGNKLYQMRKKTSVEKKKVLTNPKFEI